MSTTPTKRHLSICLKATILQLQTYLGGFTKGEHKGVATVSCDLNGAYISLAKKLLPGSAIYADKFHINKSVTGAVDDTRKRLVHVIEDDLKRKKQKRILNRGSKLMLAIKGEQKVLANRSKASYVYAEAS
ncbi:transposase [Adlercreutzia sp. ZJ154]|uniref:transposase n=1 Tax=Adlercreutzia sp. ZJ154 TaxID=2709790 RepID=UPI0013EDCC1E